MEATSSINSEPSAVDYVRQARRLRARHGGNLPHLHRSLSSLPPPRTNTVSEVRAVPPVFDVKTLRREAFASAVRGCLDGPILRYSMRVALLKQAGRLGVGRFEANLVIAEVQHAARHEVGRAPTPAIAQSSFGVWVLTAIVVQVLVVGAAWWVFTAL